VDLWGIGVIMYECLFGYPPFTDESSKEVCHKVANWIEYLEFPADVEVSTVAKMLILGLVNDSNRRLTIN
jgi:serine/threonine protein kinase